MIREAGGKRNLAVAGIVYRPGALALDGANFEKLFGSIKMSPKPKASHGGRRPGAGAPTGPRNGRWTGGRYSRALTPKERQAAWRAYWAEKRAQRGIPDIPVPDVSDSLREFYE